MKCEDVDIHEHTEQESRFEPTSILKSSLLWPVRSHVLSASLQKLWRKRRTILPARHNHNDHSCDNPIGTQGPSESKVRMYFIASAVSALQLFQLSVTHCRYGSPCPLRRCSSCSHFFARCDSCGTMMKYVYMHVYGCVRNATCRVYFVGQANKNIRTYGNATLEEKVKIARSW